jgi:hypothetical protein
MKLCKDCGKPTGCISNKRQRCVDCLVIKRKQTQRDNKLKYQYHKQPKSRYASYKRGAEARGLSFDLTLEEFAKLWNKPCTYCAEPVEGIGIDRIDNSKGYTIDNTCSCCTICNMMKHKMSQEDFINKCKQIAGVLLLEQVDSSADNQAVKKYAF